MSFISNILFLPFQNGISCCSLTASVFVLIIVFIVSRFYLRVLRYPKGPFPYPVIGNLTYLNPLKGVNPHKALSKLHLKYGPVFTFWISHKPFVLITDLQLVKETFQKPEFSHRGFKYLAKAATLVKGHDFIFNDYNWVYLDQKKIILSAMRKYVVTDELNKAASECVDEFWDEIKRKGLEKPIDMPKYIHLIITNIMARSLFGAKYTFDDSELMYLKNALKNIQRGSDVMTILEGLPDSIGEFLFNFLIKTSWFGFQELVSKMTTKYHQHLDSYEDGQIRDVVDALIAAKEEAILEDKKSAEHLNDTNLINILSDLYVGSINTTSCLCQWIFLLMAKYPEMQSRMRREIKEVVGDRMPTQQDKENCHFTMAFIHEALRLHVPVPLSLPHQTKTDVEIGGHKIPAQTTIISYLHSIHRNPDIWSNPDEFDPNRMLEADGKLQLGKLSGLVPFGSGRRACPGYKLAQIDAFLIVARLLQITDQLSLEFASDGNITLEPDPKMFAIVEPVHYKLMLKRRLD